MTRWFGEDFPTKQVSTFNLKSNNSLTYQSIGLDLDIRNEQFNTVWFRRPTTPKLPNSVHPDDVQIASRENLDFFRGMWWAIGDNAFWVNPYLSMSPSSSKLNQLIKAARAGMQIPETLISNDHKEISEFIEKLKNGNVIYKTFAPSAWNLNDGLARLHTTNIDLEDLPKIETLQLTAGIFQEKIIKDFEVRVTYFGNFPVAVKLLSQKHELGKTDWRSIPSQELEIEQFQLPQDMHTRCLQIMDSLGIVFGCFDLIVKPSGEYYFLEVNPIGQFLWIEQLCPDILARTLATELTAEELTHVSGGYTGTRDPSTLPPNCQPTEVRTSIDGGPETTDDPDYICVF